jgi:iron complex outermembrane receptor protein
MSAAACAWLPGTALAQSSGTAETTLGELVVTAQKREQNLQDVAGSISALGAAQLKAEGVSSIQDVALRVPGLDFGTHNGANFVTLRGIGLAVDTGVAEPNVAIHTDGLFLPRTTMSTLDHLDLERVEVLRGPQGTLYGRNATGGTINFVSQAPRREPGGEAQLLVGNYETVEARAMATGPLGETVRGRLSFGYVRRGEGYLDNEFTGKSLDKLDRYMIRGALTADLSEGLTADLSVSFQREEFETYQQLVQPMGPAAAFFFPPLATAVAPSKPWTIGSDYNPDSKRSTLIVRGGLIWQVAPDIEFKSITGYIDHKFTNQLDGDGTSAAYVVVQDRKQPSESVSQEFNLGGALPKGGNWIVGAYAFREDFTSSIPIPLPSGIPVLQLPPGTILLSELKEKTTSVAAFADVTIGVTEALRVYGGARVARDEKKFRQTAGAIIPGVPASLTLSCNDQRSSQTFESFSPRIGVQYDVAEGVKAYAQYSKGFKSGGLNSSACGDKYDPEKLQAGEVGLKTELLDGRATVNVSAFYYDYKSLQIFKIVSLNAQIENGDARTYGADIEAKFRINEHWRVDASATLLDAKFTNFSSADPANPAAGVQDLRGDRIPNAPKYLANLGVEANWPIALGPFSTLTVRGDIRWSGTHYFQAFNTPGYRQGASALGNLNAVLATPDRRLSLRAYMRNVGDKAVLSHVIYSAIQDAYEGNYLQPRTYGIEVIRSF